jgi:hypothetical protein
VNVDAVDQLGDCAAICYGRGRHPALAPDMLVEGSDDDVLDISCGNARDRSEPDDFIKPRAIADEIWHLVHQDRSAWSFNVELRPFGENW